MIIINSLLNLLLIYVLCHYSVDAMIQPGSTPSGNITHVIQLEVGFERHPEDVNVTEGNNATLHCIFTKATDKCYWQKDGNNILLEKRYMRTSFDEHVNCSLDIINVNFKLDNGIWRCGLPQTSISPGLKSKIATLTVFKIPSPPIIAKHDGQLQNGSELVVSDFSSPLPVTCISKHGNPASQLLWKLEDEDLFASNLSTNTEAATLLKTSTLKYTDNMNDTWENKKLFCISKHPANKYDYVTYVHIRKGHPPWLLICGGVTLIIAIIVSVTYKLKQISQRRKRMPSLLKTTITQESLLEASLVMLRKNSQQQKNFIVNENGAETYLEPISTPTRMSENSQYQYGSRGSNIYEYIPG